MGISSREAKGTWGEETLGKRFPGTGELRQGGGNEKRIGGGGKEEKRGGRVGSGPGRKKGGAHGPHQRPTLKKRFRSLTIIVLTIISVHSPNFTFVSC
jgi:hypothetical protein